MDRADRTAAGLRRRLLLLLAVRRARALRPIASRKRKLQYCLGHTPRINAPPRRGTVMRSKQQLPVRWLLASKARGTQLSKTGQRSLLIPACMPAETAGACREPECHFFLCSIDGVKESSGTKSGITRVRARSPPSDRPINLGRECASRGSLSRCI